MLKASKPLKKDTNWIKRSSFIFLILLYIAIPLQGEAKVKIPKMQCHAYAVMDAGVNWYEAEKEFDIILEGGNELRFVITPLTGGNVTHRSIALDGLPERPAKTTRLNIHVEMTAVDQAAITVEDMGFGEFFPSSGKAWTHNIQV